MKSASCGFSAPFPTIFIYCIRNPRPVKRGVPIRCDYAIEACIEIAQHICSAQGWGPPADNGDAMNVLGRHGVLTAELSDAMRKAVGFRNVLVHEYVEVSDAIVESRLSDLRDLKQDVEQVTAFLRDGPAARA